MFFLFVLHPVRWNASIDLVTRMTVTCRKRNQLVLTTVRDSRANQDLEEKGLYGDIV